MRLALALIFSLAAAPAFASEATDLAEKVIAAYGGAEAIERARSTHQSGTLESYRHAKTGTVERSFTRPDRLRVEIRIPGEKPEIRILDGDRGWLNGQPVRPMMVKAMYLQLARMELPWLVLKSGADVVLLGPVKHGDGRDLKALEIPVADGVRLVAVVDPETGLIVRSHGRVETAPGVGVDFGTLYEGYGELNGMVLATEETHFARGHPTGKTMLETSEVVPGFPDSLFKP